MGVNNKWGSGASDECQTPRPPAPGSGRRWLVVEGEKVKVMKIGKATSETRRAADRYLPPRRAEESSVPPRRAEESSVPPRKAEESSLPPRRAADRSLPPMRAEESSLPPRRAKLD
jgi:hypothetical protein